MLSCFHQFPTNTRRKVSTCTRTPSRFSSSTNQPNLPQGRWEIRRSVTHSDFKHVEPDKVTAKTQLVCTASQAEIRFLEGPLFSRMGEAQKRDSRYGPRLERYLSDLVCSEDHNDFEARQSPAVFLGSH